MNQSEIIARAIVRLNTNQVILCRLVGEKWYFLPGGHVEFGESSVEALRREFIEEMGNTSISIENLVGVIENTFQLDEKIHHELNMVLTASLDDDQCPESIESHLQFAAYTLEEIKDMKIMPPGLKDIILQSNEKFNWRIINEL